MALYKFKLNLPTQTVESCIDGCPLNKLPPIPINKNGTILMNQDILYSLYYSYQNTFTPQYIQNNLLQLTNPNNYSSLPPGPSNIFIIRHGEKNSDNKIDPTNNNNYYTLNCNGIYRSTELLEFINNLGKDGYPITAIITGNPQMNININGDVSIRPQNTINNASWFLNIPLYIFSSTTSSQPYDATTAINIFTNSYFHGKNILVVWEHGNIQSLTNQIVQCYNYFKSGGTIDNLNNSTLYNVSTESWWEQNTPVLPEYQYSGLSPNQGTPAYPIPYVNYSKYLPYWNTNTYDKVYWLSQTNVENSLTFSIFYENIKTCFTNCHLLIGLIQYGDIPPPDADSNWTPSYINDKYCLPPSV